MSRGACVQPYVVTFNGKRATVDAASPESAAEMFAERHEIDGGVVSVARTGELATYVEVTVTMIPQYHAQRIERRPFDD